MRRAVSVTLDQENLLWLRVQAGMTARGSLSEVLDRLVTDARAAGRAEAVAIRSVRGTIDLPDSDPALEEADAYIREQFSKAVRRPVLVRDPPVRSTAKRKKRG